MLFSTFFTFGSFFVTCSGMIHEIAMSLHDLLTSIALQRPQYARRFLNDTQSVETTGNTAVQTGRAAIAADAQSEISEFSTIIEPGLPSTRTIGSGLTTTITYRVTVTATSETSTTTPSLIAALLSPQVAVVAAQVVPEVSASIVTAPAASVQFIYVPTTIYITRPCAATTPVTQASFESASDSAINALPSSSTVMTQAVQASVASKPTNEVATTSGSAVVQAALIAASEQQAGASQVLETVRVVQTSTVTIHLPATSSTSNTGYVGVEPASIIYTTLVSSFTRYSNVTMTAASTSISSPV